MFTKCLWNVYKNIIQIPWNSWDTVSCYNKKSTTFWDNPRKAKCIIFIRFALKSGILFLTAWYFEAYGWA